MFPVKIAKIHFHILGLQVSPLLKINQFHLNISWGFVNVCVKWRREYFKLMFMEFEVFKASQKFFQ